MKELNLIANTTAQEKVKEYLEQNVSDVLADKINNGVPITKGDKTLINKKTLDGFMKYATEEARKQAEKGARCACIEDSIVFGWAIHYFEEDSIEGTLYNEDGTEYKVVKPAPKKKTTTTPKAATKKAEETKPQTVDTTPPQPQQMTLFDLMG